MLSLAFIPSLGVPELIVFGLIILLLFGSRLPGVMKSLGQSFTAFKQGTREGELEDKSESKSDNEKK